MNRVMSLGQDMGWRRKAIRLANFPGESLLLDVAAGTGDMTLAALKVNPEAKIVDLDFCKPLLLQAQAKLEKRNGFYPVKWIEGNGLQLPFKNESFNGAFTGFSLRNVVDVKKLFLELYRITKPDGKVVSLEMMKQKKSVLKPIFSIYFKQIIPLLGRWFTSHPDAYSYLPLSIENFYTADELTEVIFSAGWKNVYFKPIMFGTVAIHAAKKEEASNSKNNEPGL